MKYNTISRKTQFEKKSLELLGKTGQVQEGDNMVQVKLQEINLLTLLKSSVNNLFVGK